jgi:hypothetical protein
MSLKTYDYKGAELSNVDGGTSLSNQGTRLGGKLRCAIAEYEADGVAISKTIEMIRLPKGATMIEGFLSADALGSGVTLAVGGQDQDSTNANDADRYLAATAMNTANKRVALTPPVPTKLTAENGDQLYITVAGAAATGTIVLVVFYIEEID